MRESEKKYKKGHACTACTNLRCLVRVCNGTQIAYDINTAAPPPAKLSVLDRAWMLATYGRLV